MSDDYEKVILGEAVEDYDDSTPLVPAGIPVDVPVSQQQNYYRTQTQQPMAPSVYGTTTIHIGDEFKDGGEDCAHLGCLFSWIPIIGCVTCCIHSDAPLMSKREYYAHRACCIAMLTTIIILFIYLAWYTYNDCDSLSCD